MYRYFAFISYNSQDLRWGKRVQRKLEHYRMPATLCSRHGWEQRKPMQPIFFAPTDIQPGELTPELQARLRDSRHLIVICSPRSAKSEWVGREIAYFHRLGRTRNIHFFIIDGEPHSSDPERECFNPAVGELGLPEILGANIHERIYRWSWLNRQRAYVQLITKLLGVEFDTLWKRHRRRLIRKIVAWTAGLLAVLAGGFLLWQSNRPVDIAVRLQETAPLNPELPPLADARITLTLDNETKTDTLRAPADGLLYFANIPHNRLGRPAHLTVSCRDCLDLDTTLVLSSGIALPLRRDPAVYGEVRVTLWNPDTERPVAGCPVQVAGYTAETDADGTAAFFVPLEEQRTKYVVSAPFLLENDTLYMPCGEVNIFWVR